MKKNPPNVWVRPHCVKKMLQVMKLALLFVVLFFTSASAFTQRVSLSVKAETTLNEVLKQVKDQTGVRILYDAGKMKRVPCREMKITDMEIAEALKQILKDTRFEFFEEGGVFIVREALSQQAKVIRLVGKVTDERKQPLPGVTVQLKGFSIGTATNGEGRYQLSIPNAPEKFSLVFSFVGMVSQEITYAGKDTINVVMKEDVETLEDVVVITTVTPKAGKLNVDYNFVGDVIVPDLTDYNLLNAREKLEVERLAGCFVVDENDSYTDPYNLKKEYNEKLANVTKGVNTYWLSKPLQTVFNHKHSVYVDGGGENVRFGIELLYANQDGVMKGSLRDRVSAGFSLQYTYKTFMLKNQLSYQRVRSEESPYGDFSDYAKQLPYDEYKDENGQYVKTMRYWGTGGDMNRPNPLYEAGLKNFNKSDTDEFINNFSLNWSIVSGLLLKGQLSLTKTMGESKRFYDPLSQQPENLNHLSVGNLASGALYLTHDDGLTWDLNATLSYNKVLNNHMINALAGVNMQETKSDSDNATYLGFPSGDLSSPEYAKEMYNKTDFSESTRRLLGFIFSANYSFKDIYLADISLRIDGSSAFGADKRFAPFWSLGLGVNLHKYKFFQDLGFIDQLKIRGSYGQTGKANFPAYAARTMYLISTDNWYKTGISTKLQALGNKNLTWETTNSLDVGGEVTLFKGLLYVKGSYYNKRTIDLINDVTVPTSTGFTSYRDNIGEISNKGYEFDLRVSAFSRNDLSVVFNANLAHNVNRIEKISESLKAYNERVKKMFEESYAWDDPEKALQSQPFLQYEEGGSLSSIWGVRSLGINPADGQEVFLNREGRQTKSWSASDQVVLGTSEPTVQGMFGFNVVYKQFSLFANFMYEAGGQRYNQTLVDKVENVNVYTDNVDERVLTGRWKKAGDHAKYKALTSGRDGVESTKPTSRFVQDYNMLSWNSLELGYDMPADLTKKLNLSMCRFTLGMTDLLHLSSVKQERGTSYPFARTVSFSVKISL